LTKLLKTYNIYSPNLLTRKGKMTCLWSISCAIHWYAAAVLACSSSSR